MNIHKRTTPYAMGTHAQPHTPKLDVPTGRWESKQNRATHDLMKKYPQDRAIIERFAAHQIPVTEENILAIQAARHGTTVEEADYLTRLIQRDSASPVYDMVVESLADTLADQLIATLQESKNVTRTTTVHQSTNVIHHQQTGNTYTKNIHASYEGLSYEEHGFFKHPDMQEALEKTIDGHVDPALKQESKANITAHFDDIVDDLSTYDFEVLVRQAVLSNDGVLSPEDLQALSRLPYDYVKAQESYMATIEKLKTYGQNISGPLTAEGMSTLLHDGILNDPYAAYLPPEAAETLRELKRHTEAFLKDPSIPAKDALASACDQLNPKEVSRARLIHTVFKGPNGERTNRPNAYTQKARYMFKLLHLSNIDIAYDGVKRNPTVISTDLSSPGYEKKSVQLRAQTAQRIRGKHLFNKIHDRQLLMNLFTDKRVQLLDIHFIQGSKMLSFANFILNIHMSIAQCGEGTLEIAASNYNVNIGVKSDSSAFLTHFKHRASGYVNKAKQLGFEDVRFSLHHTNTTASFVTDDQVSHKIRAEHQMSTQTEVSI